MITIEKLSKKYGDIRAVDTISLNLPKGQITGLLGPNGAGKSTTINCIAGLLTPSEGRVIVGGHDIHRHPKDAKQILGVVPQELALYEDLSARDNLAFWGSAYGLRGDALQKRIADILTVIGLADRADDLPATFSGGMKRRLNFGCAIVHQPEILLLDEPTVGVDPQSREKLFELIEAERDRGTTILYTTHYMEEAERLCSHLAIIDHGSIVAEGSLDSLRASLGEKDLLQIDGDFPDSVIDNASALFADGAVSDISVDRITATRLSLSLEDGGRKLPQIFDALRAAGARIHASHLRRPTLETLFLRLTGRELRS